MNRTLFLALLAAAAPIPALADHAAQPRVATPFLPIDGEPAPRLIVDPPLPEPLARGAVIVPYRLENVRIVPVLGAGALDVSPRVGHLHVTVDNLPWHWAYAGDTNTIVVVGLPAGEHSLLVELADPLHRIYPGQATTIRFTVPASGRPHH